jgi:hypothetical protein
VPVLAVGLGLLWAYALVETAGSQEIVRSPWWAWGWLLVPIAAAVLGRFWRHPSWLLAVALCGPAAVAFVTHDRRDTRLLDTSGWPIGWLLLAGMGAVVTVVARASAPRSAPDS